MKNFYLSNEEKQFMFDILEELNQTLQEDSMCPYDENLPSLQIWINFQRYLNKILDRFSEESNLDKIENIYVTTKIDEYVINARDYKQKSIESLKTYINLVYENLNS